MKSILERLRRLSNIPDVETDEFKNGLEQNNDAMKFLHQNEKDDWCVICSRTDNVLIHGVLVPEQALKPLDIDDILMWDGNPYCSWDVISRESETWVEAPLAGSGSETLKRGEQLVFMRSSKEVLDDQSYVEISQKFTHSLGLHYRADQKAWLKPDKNGDVKPFIKVVEEENWLVVLFDRVLLSAYAALTSSVLVRMFDFPAYYEVEKFPHMYHRTISGLGGCYYRGAQLLKPAMSKQWACKNIGIDFNFNREKKYESFIALDWRNKGIVEVSCLPDTYKLLPAFFRQEVLAKYKSDQKKYSFNEYSVAGLKYGVNDEGQVHVWLVDLGNLSYEEQQYWKLYNEPPRPAITDFEQTPEQILKSVLNKGFFEAQIKGSWDYQLTALSALKETLRKLHGSKCPWWKASSSDRIDQINYPIEKSFNDCADWEREILALCRLIIEGLQDKWLKAKELGQDVERMNGSLIKKCLVALGHKDTDEVIAPLRELKKLRNKVSPAHEQLKEKDKQEVKKLKAEVLDKHASYWKHYDYLVGACNKTFLHLEKVFDKN